MRNTYNTSDLTILEGVTRRLIRLQGVTTRGYYNGLQGVAVCCKGLDRGYYRVARRYEFYFRIAKQYFTNERSE